MLSRVFWVNQVEACQEGRRVCRLSTDKPAGGLLLYGQRSKSPSRPKEKSIRLCCGCPMGGIVKTYDRTSLQFLPGKAIRPYSSGFGG